MKKLLRLFTLGIILLLLSVFFQNYTVATLELKHSNLYNPQFADRNPNLAAITNAYVMADPEPEYRVIKGDYVYVAFTVLTPIEQLYVVQHSVSGSDLNTATQINDSIEIYKAMDVKVEGNTRGACSCPAGQVAQRVNNLPENNTFAKLICVPDSQKDINLQYVYCPTSEEAAVIQADLIRQAPFSIKDALYPAYDKKITFYPNRTEVFVARLKVPETAQAARYTLKVNLQVPNAAESAASTSVQVKVENILLEKYFGMESSHWFSVDPRDLISKPPDPVRIVEKWGPEWWSESHWNLLQAMGQQLYEMGNRSVQVPNFIRDPFGIDTVPMVPIKCITGNNSVPSNADYSYDASKPYLSSFNQQISQWKYAFNTTNLSRWLTLFKGIGFEFFEGLPVVMAQGEIPITMECDLYTNAGDALPYKTKFSFLKRLRTDLGENPLSYEKRKEFFHFKFLPSYYSTLATEIVRAGIKLENYRQHLIDENHPSFMTLFKNLAASYKLIIPRSKIKATINQWNVDDYIGVIDIPVINIELINQRPNLLVNYRAQGIKVFFYNTSTSPGTGIGRVLDASPVSARAYPWIGLERYFDGYLFWASNNYRYPKVASGSTAEVISAYLESLGRSPDWSPVRYTIGPNPGGKVNPGQMPGGSWFFYPTARGPVPSLRSVRFREGLVDYFLYTKARLVANGCQSCLVTLQGLKTDVMGNWSVPNDQSRNPAAYTKARNRLIDMILTGH